MLEVDSREFQFTKGNNSSVECQNISFTINWCTGIKNQQMCMRSVAKSITNFTHQKVSKLVDEYQSLSQVHQQSI